MAYLSLKFYIVFLSDHRWLNGFDRVYQSVCLHRAFDPQSWLYPARGNVRVDEPDAISIFEPPRYRTKSGRGLVPSAILIITKETACWNPCSQFWCCSVSLVQVAHRHSWDPLHSFVPHSRMKSSSSLLRSQYTSPATPFARQFSETTARQRLP